MGSGKEFVEVLDAALDGYAGPAPDPIRAAQSTNPSSRLQVPVATPSFLPPRQAVSAAVVARGTHGLWRAGYGPTITPRRFPPPRSHRTLSMTQQDALDALIRLGARLEADFTQAELRAAFRMLALRYHPDRHVTCDDAERAHLAALFATAHDAYERLKEVAEVTLH
jgi:hypothetical protein